MHLPRVRFRVRRILLVIASIAMLLWARSEVETLMRRRAYYLEKAEVHASRKYDSDAGNMCLKDEFYGRGITEKDRSDFIDRLGSYNGEMERKYRAAASHPWLSVEKMNLHINDSL